MIAKDTSWTVKSVHLFLALNALIIDLFAIEVLQNASLYVWSSFIRVGYCVQADRGTLHYCIPTPPGAR